MRVAGSTGVSRSALRIRSGSLPNSYSRTWNRLASAGHHVLDQGRGRRFAGSRRIRDSHGAGIIHKHRDHVLLRLERGHAQRRVPKQEQQQRRHGGFQQPDGYRTQPAQHPVVAVNVQEENGRSGQNTYAHQPERPRRKKNKMAFLKQADRVFEEDFKHGVHAEAGSCLSIDAEGASPSYRHCRHGVKPAAAIPAPNSPHFDRIARAPEHRRSPRGGLEAGGRMARCTPQAKALTT